MKMRTHKTFLAVAVLALVALLAPSTVAQAVSFPFPLPGESAAQAMTADDTNVAMYCKYVGSGAGGFVTTAAGNISFESPDTSTADTTFECPVSGGLGGIVDTTNAACNTLGEVVDAINTSSSNFRCFIHAGLRADSSNTRLLAATDVACNQGCAIYWDTSTAFESTLVVAPQRTTAEWTNFYMLPGTRTPVRNPWAAQSAVLWSASATSTYGSGTSSLVVYTADDTNVVGTGSETSNTLWSEAAGATTVNKLFGSCDTSATACSPAWGATGLYGRNGQKLIARLLNSAAQASTTFVINGQSYPKPR